jgi:5-methylcytosine-specific restriction protein A
MASKPKRPCRYPGCPAIVPGGGLCGEHKREQRRREDADRLSATQRGYGTEWRRRTARFRRQNPLCVNYARCGNRTTTVDHIVPARKREDLFWDESNWQAMCGPCHSRKTAVEDGGYGRV